MTASLFSRSTSAETPARGSILPEQNSAVCQPMPQVASANSDVEQELDDAIRTLGERMVQADKDGDPGGYLRDLTAAEGDPCFFTAMGELARERLYGDEA